MAFANHRAIELTRASLIVKQLIIEEDEYETDLRRVLNYGHSFGHALEAIADHQVPHGLGVLWGIEIVNWLGVRWGVTSPQLAGRMSKFVRGYFDYKLPIAPSSEALMGMLSRDKKVANGMMHFAVLKDLGTMDIIPRHLDQSLLALIGEYLATDYVFRRD